MAVSNYLQSSFHGGEWSPYAQGRSESPQYVTAMNVCRNAFPIEEGAWVRRSGTRFAATTLNGAAGRVVKFDFEASAPYIMEFTDAALRMYGVGTQTGGLSSALPSDFRLVTTNDNQTVTNISTASPAVVTTSGSHGWSTGDQVQFLFGAVTAANQMPLLCNRAFQITSTGATTFSLADPITGAPIDGSTVKFDGVIAPLGSFVVARILKIVTPYTSGSWSSVKAVQAETTATLLHGSYAPQILAATSQPAASSFAGFSLTKATFVDGPYLDPPTDGSTITPGAASGSTTLTASAATSINGGAGFKSTDVGRLVRLLSEPAAWASGTSYAVGNTVKFNGQYFSCVVANTGFQPDISVAYWAISTTAATWSYATITGFTNSLVVTATISGATLVNTNAMTTWRLGVYSDTTGYPTCGVYYEARIWFAGAIANRVDASRVNGISGTSIDMTPTAADGTVADSNGISYIFNASDVNPIFWMLAQAAGILCGTKAGEWLIQASQLSDPITPTSIQAHRVTTYGCANIDPQATELTACFVHRYNRKVLEYFPDVFSGKYSAPNLSKFAKHLTQAGISEIRYQQELLPNLWSRCADGTLIGSTYKRSSLYSSQGPEINGWHRHDLGSARTVQSITVGPSTDGTLDTLAMVTNDPTTNVRHVEVMTNLFDINASLMAAWFCDDAVVPSGGTISTSTAGVTSLTLNGLWHLNGKTVTAWVGGMDAGDGFVANGSLSIVIDTDLLNANALSSAYLRSISSTTLYGTMGCNIAVPGAILTVPCVVGFTFTSQGQTLRPDAVVENRSPQGPGLAKPRRSHQLGVLLNATQGISFGTSFSKLHAAQFRSPGGTAYSATQLFSGIYWDTVDDTFSFDGALAWQVSRPYPAAVVAITGFQHMSER